MDMLEEAQIIAPQSGAGPRQIIMDQQQLMAVFNGGADAVVGASAAETADGSDETLFINTEEQA